MAHASGRISITPDELSGSDTCLLVLKKDLPIWKLADPFFFLIIFFILFYVVCFPYYTSWSWKRYCNDINIISLVSVASKGNMWITTSNYFWGLLRHTLNWKMWCFPAVELQAIGKVSCGQYFIEQAKLNPRLSSSSYLNYFLCETLQIFYKCSQHLLLLLYCQGLGTLWKRKLKGVSNMLMKTMFRKRFHENETVFSCANINKGRKLFL